MSYVLTAQGPEPNTNIMEKLISRINFNKRVCIVGIGNELRSDDGVGPLFIKEVGSCKKIRENIFLLDAGVALENYLGKIMKLKPEVIIFVDAMRSEEGNSGDIRFVRAEELEEDYISTHGMPMKMLSDTIAKTTGAEIYFIGIEAGKGDTGGGLSAEVRKGLDNIVNSFRERLCMN